MSSGEIALPGFEPRSPGFSKLVDLSANRKFQSLICLATTPQGCNHIEKQ